MAELAGGLRFAEVPRPLPVVAALEELERDPAADVAVPRLPDLAHSAGAEELHADVASRVIRGGPRRFRDFPGQIFHQ